MAETPPAKPRSPRKGTARSSAEKPAGRRKATAPAVTPPEAVAAKPRKTAATRKAATAAQPTRISREKLREQADALKSQATKTARSAAVTGKAKAGSAMQSLSKFINDSAGNIDDKLGNQYGDYARYAAEAIAGAAATLDRKDIDELVSDAREFVRKSPAVAIGTAAIVGFVLMRLAKSGKAPEQKSEEA